MLHYWKPGTSKMIIYFPDAPQKKIYFVIKLQKMTNLINFMMKRV